MGLEDEADLLNSSINIVSNLYNSLSPASINPYFVVQSIVSGNGHITAQEIIDRLLYPHSVAGGNRVSIPQNLIIEVLKVRGLSQLLIRILSLRV